jgi:hypothetical protein
MRTSSPALPAGYLLTPSPPSPCSPSFGVNSTREVAIERKSSTTSKSWPNCNTHLTAIPSAASRLPPTPSSVSAHFLEHCQEVRGEWWLGAGPVPGVWWYREAVPRLPTTISCSRRHPTCQPGRQPVSKKLTARDRRHREARITSCLCHLRHRLPSRHLCSCCRGPQPLLLMSWLQLNHSEGTP